MQQGLDDPGVAPCALKRRLAVHVPQRESGGGPGASHSSVMTPAWPAWPKVAAKCSAEKQLLFRRI